MSRMLTDSPQPVVAEMLTESSIIVQPVGALEQHGPHLPLNTDLVIPEMISARAVERAVAAGVDAWLLPPITASKSDEHHAFAGTIWMEAATIWNTLVDVGRSVAATRAKTLVFVNGHGGNSALLQVVNREIRRRFGLRTFSMGTGTQRAASGEGSDPDERGMGIHAGHSETSVMLALRPDLVDMRRAVRNVPEHLAGFDTIGFNGFPVSFGWTADDFGNIGVIGDATGATAEYGEQLVEEGTSFVAQALREIARFRHAA
ncbi:creatininase family protein [Microbacterium amylolyticum]|uniref:Creatinine amidohydrolase n=1 Tax=Microbacterium amylolyticum TaxID=936337 RepID=A0ABS4ZJ45_9MICO|nr:creatininase family protein [Microbacterium amylolyticum]MBP2437289.1 creatinine amidohydrolase [Microbacterium amylolyticum]